MKQGMNSKVSVLIVEWENEESLGNVRYVSIRITMELQMKKSRQERVLGPGIELIGWVGYKGGQQSEELSTQKRPIQKLIMINTLGTDDAAFPRVQCGRPRGTALYSSAVCIQWVACK